MELCYRNNPKSLFRKYAFLITSLTKHQVFRDYIMDRTFPMHQEELGLLLPNGYHLKPQQIGRNLWQGKMIITTKAIYSPKLYFSLLKIDLMLEQWKLSFEDLQKILLMDLGLYKYSLSYPQIFLAQSTFNPAGANANKRYYKDTQTSWTLARDATSSAAEQDSGIVNSSKIGTDFFCSKIANNFDTSTLPDVATILDTTNIQIYHVDNGSNANADSTSVQIVSHTPTTAPNWTAGDVDPTKWGTTVFASQALSGITLNQYTTYTLDANGRANISLTTFSNFGYRNNRDTSNTEPTGANRIDHQGTNPVKLVVDYTVGGYAYFM